MIPVAARAAVITALLLVSSSSAWATNSVLVGLSRIDDFASPGEQFSMDIVVDLDAPGVTAVTVAATGGLVTFSESPPGSGQWEQDDDVTFADLSALQTALDGTFSVTISGSSPSVSTFSLNANALVDGDFFPTPTNLSPANGATSVSTTTMLSWTDPTGAVTPYALNVAVRDFSTSQEALSIPALGVLEIPLSATSWQPPAPLDSGPTEFSVFYANVDASVTALISALQVTSGMITWDTSDFAPPSYPAATPFLVLAAESTVQFDVPEPSAGLLGAAALATLGILSSRRRRS